MLALYPPPHHLRGDAKKQTEALAAYAKALAAFDGPTLAAGWELVTAEHQFWVWPNPGVVVEACRRCAPPPPAVGDQESRRLRADALADDYAARFMRTTHLAKLAAAGGWAAGLRAHVRAAAWVQAQIICGVRGIGFPSELVPVESRGQSAQECFETYKKAVAGPLARGRIRVTVPPSLAREWSRAACNDRATRRSAESPGR